MNKNLSLRRMTLLGFMLMTMSINVLANNTNEEEKNTTTVVVEKSVNRSVAEGHDKHMTISLQEGPVSIPYEFDFAGYQFDIDQTDIVGADPGCIEWVNDGARIFRIRINPIRFGQAILKLIFIAIGDYEDGPAPSPIVVNIHITVNR